ncbi:hypothetical protein Petty_11 [Acinetobacter phage Petty]|uniref:Uncharacterized protein n=1 Tax=Acinetobacter phage Petty TaxID=1406779 RepID=U5PZL0_9CAUD|nr:hypothetical protein Petty_11 [Acinetobacter phage Petty]AGY47983.1 hypothetical protein Petty_11 [Acinetobacter phage Petty]
MSKSEMLQTNLDISLSVPPKPPKLEEYPCIKFWMGNPKEALLFLTEHTAIRVGSSGESLGMLYKHYSLGANHSGWEDAPKGTEVKIVFVQGE